MEPKQKKGSDVEEGNKMIKEFMGEIRIAYTQLEYHSSWDWLMPVVKKVREKIDLMPHDNLILTGKWFKISGGITHVDIHETFESVIEFIKWHNQNPHP